jgi:hypothetical protein
MDKIKLVNNIITNSILKEHLVAIKQILAEDRNRIPTTEEFKVIQYCNKQIERTGISNVADLKNLLKINHVDDLRDFPETVAVWLSKKEIKRGYAILDENKKIALLLEDVQGKYNIVHYTEERDNTLIV